MNIKLLSRDQFRESVFKRDSYKCVICLSNAVDAHHILERRLWSDGGYYIDNGASLCSEHHLEAESTELSVELIREKCGITKPIIPLHLYDDQIYDKWGNPILPNGNRLKGELFFDESVQKIIKNYLHLFTSWVKYPRTYHLPWSEGMCDDDRMLESLDAFKDKRVIISLKYDGESTTMYKDYIHARSVDGRSHPTRNWVKQFRSQICHDIPEDWRICGENLYAKHSIGYDNLPSYFMGFSIWNEKNTCLSWEDTIEWFQLLGIIPVKVVYDDVFNEQIIKNVFIDYDWSVNEGYVIRLAESFSYGEFRYKVGKYVRKNHVQTTKHWMHGQQIEKNKLNETYETH